MIDRRVDEQEGQSKSISLAEVLCISVVLLIVAAFLYPVYGGRRTISYTHELSNIKQVGLSALMYAGDYDDRFPPAGRFDSRDPAALWRGDPQWAYVVWPQLTGPYLKQPDLFVFAEADTPAGATGKDWKLRLPSMGMNYCAVNDVIDQANPDHPRALRGRTSSELIPAETMMLAGRTAPTQFDYASLFAWDHLMLPLATVHPPVCLPGVPHCFGQWGTQSIWLDTGFVKDSDADGVTTGLLAYHPASAVVTALADGHAKSLKKSALLFGAECDGPCREYRVVDPVKFDRSWFGREFKK